MVANLADIEKAAKRQNVTSWAVKGQSLPTNTGFQRYQISNNSVVVKVPDVT